VNTHLLDKLADDNGGVSTYVAPNEDLELAVSSFYTKISHPVLSDLSLDFGGTKAYDVHPQELPDLFRGGQLTLFGRYEGHGGARITLTGQTGGKRQTFEYEASFPEKSAEQDFIPRLWAQRKIGYLLDEIRIHGERKELKQEIVDLSLEYGVVTPYTSYLVQEDERIARRNIPVDFAGAFGRGRVLEGPRGPAGALPAPSAAMPAERVKGADLATATGEAGFRAARVAKELRAANRVDTGEAVRYVARRTMYADGEAWRQVRREEPQRTLEIKYASRAYFDLLKARPDWGPLFALGEKVEFLTDHTLIRIGDAGREQLSEEELGEITK
jgi:Ca-activated chloride channel family protein